jgi:soluble lytic murein transglycosylase-like protein
VVLGGLLCTDALATDPAQPTAKAAQTSPAAPLSSRGLWTGTEALRSGHWDQALKELRAGASYQDTAYHNLKLGLACLGLKDYSGAVPFLQTAAQRSTTLAPCAYELLGDAELARRNTQGGFEAYRLALVLTMSQSHQRRLQDKVSAAVIANSIDTSQMPWVAGWFRPSQSAENKQRRATLDSLVSAHQWVAAEARVTAYADSLSPDDLGLVLDSLFGVSFPDSAMPQAAVLYKVARAAGSCQYWDYAETWLDRTARRPEFPKGIALDDYLMFRGTVSTRRGKYTEAIGWIGKLEKSFKPTSLSVLTLARVFRNIGNKGKSTREYRRYLELFPHDAKTPDIYWFLAWQEEDNKNNTEALSLYHQIFERYRRSSRGEEALFRYALLRFKLGQVDSARSAWQQLLKRYPGSAFTTAASYWRAKCLLAQGVLDSACQAFSAIVVSDPFNYYSYRSREMLALSGDVVDSLVLDSVCDCKRAQAWLDSISPDTSQARDSVDSIAYAAGTLLAMSGMTDAAAYFLEPLETAHPSGLRLGFDIAELYSRCGSPAQSYLVSRRLSWRIPVEARRTIPLPIHALLFPQAYRDVIHTEAERNGISPDLVSAVIRQESIFDAQIQSPAGAIGLMQIMPQTGRTIASKLHEPFAPESLSNPATSIRFGAYYLHELIDQFDGYISLALASYNGGPNNAQLWYNQNRYDSFDVFVEDIAFSETRGYVKKVLANYWTYMQLGRVRSYPGCGATCANP